MNKMTRKFKQKELYHWLQDNKDKTIVVEDNEYMCFSTTQLIKQGIDNLVLEMEICNLTNKLFIKLEDEESLLGYKWIKVYVNEVV